MKIYQDIEILRKKREGWVKSNRENNFEDGINNLLTELYPDNAHFLYELLQNAEDTGATEVSFELFENKLLFKHNGRVFNAKDIEGITSIGQGTKKDDINQIGKFGVGFKAVFSYTQTPIIHSGKYHFKIIDLVVPIQVSDEYFENTLMEFPFNEPKKTRETAFNEIKRGLEEIEENTLLFLKNIKSIEYSYQNKNFKLYLQKKDNNIFEITHTGKKETTKWLRFNKQVPNKEPLYVSIAFRLKKDIKTKKENIAPVDGKVSIFFPAEKENSNLKFHIHAPFASTVARDSIKDREENNFLISLIADLVSESLPYIKEKDYLNFNFLKCLPIKDDNLSNFYKPIQDKILYVFNNEEYVLTDNKHYKPAIKCYRASSTLKKIVNIEFLKLLIYDEMEENNDIYWIKNPSQLNSREDKFLKQLYIRKFDDETFVDELDNKISFFKHIKLYLKKDLKIVEKEIEEDELIIYKLYQYLVKKSDKWWGKLYAYLYDYTYHITEKSIIKLSDNQLNINDQECYFSEKNLQGYNIVKKEVYTSNNKAINQNAKFFLVGLGVNEIGEEERIKTILGKYYSNNRLTIDIKIHLKNIELFIKFYEENLSKINIFKNKYLFLNENNTKLKKASELILDEPYLDTKMKLLKKINYTKNDLISEIYKTLENEMLFIKFLEDLDIVYEIKIKKEDIFFNKNFLYLKQDKSNGAKEIYHTKINEDYNIQNLENLLQTKKIDILLLIWNALIKAENRVFKARYRPNGSYPIRESDSKLIQKLKEYKWIPDNNGKFYKPADISKEMLNDKFIYDNNNGWLDAINFGENIKKKNREYQEVNKTIKEKTGYELDILEKAHKAGVTIEDIERLVSEKQSLKNSLRENQSNGNTKQFMQSKNDETIIFDEEEYQKNIHKENLNNKNKFVTSETKYNRQDNKEIEKIKNFLYKEYEGHCQICGDTFADGNKNIFKIKSLNIGKNRDINRKGNSLSLCHKHHEIFKRNLQKNTFIEDLNEKINLNDIKKIFVFEEFVSKDDINDENDSFYRLDENDDFTREVYYLPIRLFGKTEYIKYTEAHISEFIEVWNNN